MYDKMPTHLSGLNMKSYVSPFQIVLCLTATFNHVETVQQGSKVSVEMLGKSEVQSVSQIVR